MTTFARWLAGHNDGTKSDPIHWLAQAWMSLDSDHRQRLSSPTSIKRVLAKQGPQDDEWQSYLAHAVDKAIEAYRERGLDTVQRLPEPSSAAADQQPSPAVNEPERAPQAADQGEAGWSAEPQQRLGTCLQCGALMGVWRTADGVKVLTYELGSEPPAGRNGAPPNADLFAANNPVLRAPISGKVGLWSKTDSTSYFKDYVVNPK